MVPPRRQGTPTLLRNCAMSSPDSPAVATTRMVPGVTLPAPSWYGPSIADSTMRATAAEAYSARRLAGRSSSPPAMRGITSASGAAHSGITTVSEVSAGMVSSSALSASQSDTPPRK